ncbi:MAG: hypothetical protein MHM6MM_009695 [Cercozoa sp. M6MM]
MRRRCQCVAAQVLLATTWLLLTTSLFLPVLFCAVGEIIKHTKYRTGGKGIAKTDLAIALPEGTYGSFNVNVSVPVYLTRRLSGAGRVAPRSGLAWKKHIDVGAGVIDADYRGNVGVVLFNHSNEDFQVSKGDRVAQLILERCVVCPVDEVEELPETTRGAGGFGSTGVAQPLVNSENAEAV